MTTIYIYSTINVMQFDGKWTYGMGKLKKKLVHPDTFSEMASYRKKKFLESATGNAYTIRGRMGKYVACDRETGRPELYLYVE